MCERDIIGLVVVFFFYFQRKREERKAIIFEKGILFLPGPGCRACLPDGRAKLLDANAPVPLVETL